MTTTDIKPKIHGWLALFLFLICIGGLASALNPLLTFDIEEYSGIYFIAIIDILFGLALCALAFYAAYSIVMRKPNAVFVAMMYTIIIFASNLIILLIGEFNDSGLGSLRQTIYSLIWGIVWISYLASSEQVEELIPSESRKIYRRDYYIIGIFVLYPMLLLSYVIYNNAIVTNREKQEEQFLSSVILHDNEYTDGRMVFTKPDGYTCTEAEMDGIAYFELDNGLGLTTTIFSYYDTDISVENFNAYMKLFIDEGLNRSNHSTISFNKHKINGHPYYIKTIEYETLVPIYWSFIMMFNVETEKVVVISSYQLDQNDSMKELLKSVKFQ